MPTRPTVGYRCPVCAAALAEEAHGYVCASRHDFDRAKEGYVNLLPGGRIKGRPAGDDDAMVRARRTVFDAGLYDPIIDAVADTVHVVVAGREAPSIVDCGCGEGTYLTRACQRCGADGWGIDISKSAVRAAARRHPGQHHAVASSYSLPFADGLFDVALSVFSPRPFAEMMRVLRADGAAVVVRPGPDHLAELKSMIYDEPRRHGDESNGDPWPILPTSERTVRFTVDLGDPVLRMALLEMTPFWWSTSTDQRAAIADRELAVTADMRISVFGRPATLDPLPITPAD